MRCIGWDGWHECSGVEEGGIGGRGLLAVT